MNIALTAEHMIMIESPKEGYCLVRQALLQEDPEDRQKEHFWVLGLDRSHHVLFLERLGLGDVQSDTDPLVVFRFSLKKNADNIMLFHSHSASSERSAICDNNVSERLIRAGRLLAIEVLDYCVITTTDYLSFSENNIMIDPTQSTSRMPHMMGHDEQTAMKKDIDKLAMLSELNGRRIGKLQGVTEVARNLLQQQFRLQDIVRATGLSHEAIEELAPG